MPEIMLQTDFRTVFPLDLLKLQELWRRVQNQPSSQRLYSLGLLCLSEADRLRQEEDKA